MEDPGLVIDTVYSSRPIWPPTHVLERMVNVECKLGWDRYVIIFYLFLAETPLAISAQ